MKKIRNFLIVCTLTFTNSCSQTEVQNVFETAIVDAEATFATYSAIVSSCIACALEPGGQAVSWTIAVISGTIASGTFGRNNGEVYTYGKVGNINLPEDSKLLNNPYEEFGIKHNLALNYMNSKANMNEYRNKMNAYDKVEWVNTINVMYPQKTNTEIDEIYNFAKEHKVMDLLIYSKYETLKTVTDFNNHLQNSNFTQPMKTKIQAIFNMLEIYSHDPNSTDNTINFINSEVNKILRPKADYTSEESRVLVFLSTYKHSLYYWKK